MSMLSLIFKIPEPEEHIVRFYLCVNQTSTYRYRSSITNYHVFPAFTYLKEQKYQKSSFTASKDLSKTVGTCDVPVELAHLAEGHFSLTGDARYMCAASPVKHISIDRLDVPSLNSSKG